MPVATATFVLKPVPWLWPASWPNPAAGFSHHAGQTNSIYMKRRCPFVLLISIQPSLLPDGPAQRHSAPTCLTQSSAPLRSTQWISCCVVRRIKNSTTARAPSSDSSNPIRVPRSCWQTSGFQTTSIRRGKWRTRPSSSYVVLTHLLYKGLSTHTLSSHRFGPPYMKLVA